MESDNTLGWAFGFIYEEKSKDCGRVKVLALLDDDKKIKGSYNDTQLVEIFPPSGCIFGPSLFSAYNNLRKYDSVIFQYQYNEQRKHDDYDSFSICRNTVTKKGFKIFKISIDMIKEEKFLDISKLQEISEISSMQDEHFFLSIGKSIIGEFIINKGKIRPKVGKEAKVWEMNVCNIIKTDIGIFLYDIPGEEIQYIYIDCMDSKQLSEWFREQLKTIDPVFIKKLDDTTNWRENLPKIFDETDVQLRELNKTRLNRVMTILENIELNRREIEVLSHNISNFKTIYEKKIEALKEEYRNEFQKEFEEERSKQNQEIANLKNQLQTLENDILERKKELNELEDIKAKDEETLNHLETNKERLLKDFSIFQSVTSPNALQTTVSSNGSLSYVIEEEKPLGTPINNKEDFQERLKYFLNKYKIKKELSSRFLNVAATFRCFFIPEISFAIALAEAAGNTKYIIQQVEPDWLHFKNFWENGLGVLWDSSHNEPDKLHLLILEDINLASPECWGRPLFDLLSGLRKKIPYGNTSWPANFKIAAAWLPFDNPKIGLPLYKQTFLDWGAVIPKDFKNNQTDNLNLKEGYIMAQQLCEWKPDELEINWMRDDISKIMDVE